MKNFMTINDPRIFSKYHDVEEESQGNWIFNILVGIVLFLFLVWLL